jgi:predicted RNA polymerase sigma factor
VVDPARRRLGELERRVDDLGRRPPLPADMRRRLGRRPDALEAYRAAVALEPPAVERAFIAGRMRELAAR